MRCSSLRLVLVVALAAAAAPALAQRVVYVDVDAAGQNTGASWADAYPDLQLALTAALPGDEVWVAEGVYKPTSGTDRRATFRMASGVALYGGFDGTEQTREERDPAANATRLSGAIGESTSFDNSLHVVDASGVDSTAVLDGFTVEWGHAILLDAPPDDVGAGLLAVGGSPTVRRCRFYRNAADAFGGRGYGGGIYVDGGGRPLVEDCVFESNGANQGSGLHAEGASPVVRRSTFRYNGGAALTLAAGAGGLVEDALFERNDPSALLVLASGGRVSRSVFRDHVNEYGTAVFMQGATTVFEDCLFEGNRSVYDGNPVAVTFSAARFERCTFRANEAAGGPVYARDDRSLYLGCLFERNVGGAFFSSTAGSLLANSAFVANRTDPRGRGAAAFFLFNGPPPGTPLLANVLAVGNTAGGGGAFGFRDGVPVHFVNVTVVGNRAEESGGAVWGTPGSGGADGVLFHNSILWDNRAPDGPIGAFSGRPTIARSLVEGGYPDGTDILDADPRFVRDPSPGADSTWGTADDDYGDLRLREGSPAVDYGDAALLPPDRWDLDLDGDTLEALPLDYAGLPRIAGVGVDLGAYEGAVPVAMEPDAADLPEDEQLALAVWPNPLWGGRGAVSFVLTEGGPITLAVYDALGRRVAVLHEGPLAAGPHRTEWDATGLRPGTYVVRLIATTGRAARGVVIPGL